MELLRTEFKTPFHIFPNIASTPVVSMTLNFPEAILLESSLSFLGLGMQRCAMPAASCGK